MDISTRKAANKVLASSLAAAVFILAPGPLAYDAAAQSLALGAIHPVAGATVGASAASAASARANLSLPSAALGAPSASLNGLSAVVSAVPSARVAAAAPAALAAVSAAPVAVSAAGPAAASVPASAAAPAAESGAPAAPAAVVKPDAEQAPAASRAAVRADGGASAIGAGRELERQIDRSADQGTAAQAGVLGQFYARSAAADDAERAPAPEEAAACAPPARCPFHALLNRSAKPNDGPGAPAAAGYAAPTSAKIPYSLGRVTNLRHKLGQWLIYKTHMEGETGYWTLPKYLGVWVIYSMILSLRTINGFSRRHLTDEAPPIPWDKKYDTQPSPNGDWTDMANGRTGGAGLARGSLFPPELIKPRPINRPRLIEIGVALFTRTKFVYANFLNQHFGAWIQAMVEGWIGSELDNANPIKIAVPPGYKWQGPEMAVPSTKEAANKKAGVQEKVFTMVESTQWMARHLYGKTKEDQDKLRAFDGFGRVKVEEGPDGQLPPDPNFKGGVHQVGQPRNMWIGRGLHDNLFLGHNHNYVADRLFRYYTEGPNFEELHWGFFARGMWYLFDRKQYLVEKAAFDRMNRTEKDDFLFHKAWLINAATIIAIHTVDWTPELLPNPVTFYAMHVEYSGLLGAKFKYAWFDKQWAHKAFGWAISTDLLSGIPGSKVQRFSSTYELDETFVNAYRIRELVRDMIRIYELRTGKAVSDLEMGKAQGVQTQAVLSAFKMVDQHYSHGLAFPGDSGVLNNVAHFFENLDRMDGLGHSDMRMMDILREDERGEPLYKNYRKGLRLSEPADFLELTGGNEELAERLASLYKTVDEVHAHVGKRAHPRPWGSVLSVDQFHIFGKYAPWRQLAYRLLSADFGPAIYTPIGVQEVLGASLKKMYLRFYPEMAPALDGPRSAFNPMNRIHPEAPVLDAKTGAVVKTLQQVHDEEVELGIVTHSLERLGVFGPLARRTLFGNSTVGELPSATAEGRAIVQPVGRLGQLLSGRISKSWQGRSFSRESGIRTFYTGLGSSAYDKKDALVVNRRTGSWLDALFVDEIRQVGPSVYVGRSYFGLPGLRTHVADFAVEYSPAPATAKLMDDERTASFAVGTAGRNYVLANTVVALTGWLLLGALSWPVAAAALIVPLVTASLSWANRRQATLGLEYASRNAPTARKTTANLIHRTFEAEASAKKAAFWDRFAGLGVMEAALIVAWRAFAAHPLVAAAIAAVGVATWLSTRGASKGFLASIDVLKTSVYGELNEKVVKQAPANLPGDSGIEKHYRYFANGEATMTPLTTFARLKALGYGAGSALKTTLSSHLLFSGKTRKNMTVGEKADYGAPFLGMFLPRIIDAYNSHGTGVYAREAKTLKDGTTIARGDVDRDVIDSWFTADRDYVTRADMNGFFEAGVARLDIPWWNLGARLGVAFGRLSFGQRMDNLFAIFPDRVVYRDGKPEKAVSKAQLLYFFSGGLQYDMARQRDANDPDNAATVNKRIVEDLSRAYVAEEPGAPK